MSEQSRTMRSGETVTIDTDQEAKTKPIIGGKCLVSLEAESDGSKQRVSFSPKTYLSIKDLVTAGAKTIEISKSGERLKRTYVIRGWDGDGNEVWPRRGERAEPC